jgi:hypothetical protein
MENPKRVNNKLGRRRKQYLSTSNFLHKSTDARTHTHTHTHTHARKHRLTHTQIYLYARREGTHCARSAADGLQLDGQSLSCVVVGSVWMLSTCVCMCVCVCAKQEHVQNRVSIGIWSGPGVSKDVRTMPSQIKGLN